MPTSSRVFPALLLVLILLAPGALGSPPPQLVGRWVLVEQTYGKGQANLADTDEPLQMEFRRESNRSQGQIWRGKNRSESRSWPVWVAEGKTLPAEAVQWEEDSPQSLRVSYRVRPSEREKTRLHVVEHYRLIENGEALVGTVKVTFRNGAKEGGSFTLHRRFERMP